MKRIVLTLALFLQPIWLKGVILHATPAPCTPGGMIERIFKKTFRGDFRILLYAEVGGREVFAIGVERDGRISGLRRLQAVQTEKGVEEYPVRTLTNCDLPTWLVPKLEEVIVDALRNVRFPEKRDLSTGSPDVYIVGRGRYFGEILNTYGGSAGPAASVCRQLIDLVAEDAGRSIRIDKLEKFLRSYAGVSKLKD